MQSDETVLAATDPMDAASAPAIRKQFHTAWRESDGPMVLDLTAVSFIDSAGIGAVVSLMKHLTRDGRTLRVTGANGQPKRMLDLVGLAHISDGVSETASG